VIVGQEVKGGQSEILHAVRGESSYAALENNALFTRVRDILESAKSNIARTVNATQMVSNWLIGREIVEQKHGDKRVTYGKSLLVALSGKLGEHFGRGFSVANLEYPKLISVTASRIFLDGALGCARINVFNISKINSEVRGGKAPRIKRMSEYLGDSYFSHLAGLNDLVLLMDESHRYRASAGVKALNELNPLFGLELTATPHVETAKGAIPFKNVVVDYPLARAMDDGFVKEPAVVTQRNFDARQHSKEEVETIKLMDGIRLHEATKVELLTYAHENNVPAVKPFILVIARDTTHAAELLNTLETVFDGRYKGKVIQVDSSRSGAAEEACLKR